MKDWPSIIADLQRRMTLRQIAEHCGFASAGAVHSLKSGVQKSCEYERGAALVELHRRLTRKR